MNDIVFDRNINIINQTINFVYNKLELNPIFPNSERVRFNWALNILNCNIAPVNTTPAWHVAHRIVQLDNLCRKIKKVREKILSVCPHRYFVNKIKHKTLPMLAKKKKELTEIIGTKGRLPFSEGIERRQFHEQCKKELQLHDKRKPLSAEIEFFHLLGNHFDRMKISAISLNYYEEFNGVCSLESWIAILNHWVKECDSAEQKIGISLLSIIQKALLFTVKSDFALGYKSNRQDLTYFKDLVRLQAPSSLGLESLSSSAFLEKYKLEEDSPVIPQSILINEIAWDMVASTHQMRAEDRQLFMVGTKCHCVAVEVSCLKPADSSDEGNYQYKIFNTDAGEDHDLDDTRTYTRPVIFTDLPQAAFSYSFFAKLLEINLNSKNMKDFYQLHDQVLVEAFAGKKDIKSGALYPIQRYGTCTYASVEAWIKSFLTEKQSKCFDIVKILAAVRKQRKMVKIYQENLRGFVIEGQLVNRTGMLLNDSIIYERVKALKENRILLTQGEDILREQTIRHVKPAKTRT